ncbi:class I SAM-dependent methyltransferase [Saccharothrix obliqua]|uniref:class I SAM-dependent methyltransferase n=1 Tax=Saccharothrix obliqua TaxID=2861747 RepID=UPI001C600B65|nr:class I SAM-dependent methyltransferase [Saccharothrix obliqua]MBW4722525.1 class I SAM-dependent methyltransferase [Saccharothrix obliqua]
MVGPVTSDELSARRANSFGVHAATYAEHRPDYPAAAIRWSLAPLGEGAHRVLDLAAGTGKLTGGLVAEGHHVTAVEPDEAMLSELVRHHGGVRALPGTAERIPVPDATMDAVVVGQAFHWFNATKALPEIARVLRPGGILAGLWNSDDYSVPWVEEFHRAAGDDRPPKMDGTVDNMPPHPLFRDPETREFPHHQRRTAESLVATIGTYSYTLVMPRAEREKLLDDLLQFLRTHPETTGEFDVPMVTYAKRTTRV